MIGIVTHDAGGAEILSSYVRRNNLDCLYCIEGPAKEIFGRKLGRIENSSLNNLMDRCDKLLCGTSLLSDLEWKALKLVQEKDINSIGVLDHWVNYRQRFIRNDMPCFPDEIWVGDKLAYQLATQQIPEIKVTLIPNPYFLDIKDELDAIPIQIRTTDKIRILFVCQPLRKGALALFGDERYLGHTEEDTLRYFLSNVLCISDCIDRIVIRAHPRESKSKYDWVEEEFNLPIINNENKTLVEQIAESDVVVGGATMAMVVGLIAKKRVVCCLPPNSKVVRLPQIEILDISSLIDLTKH
jgi:hypothetical protein